MCLLLYIFNQRLVLMGLLLVCWKYLVDSFKLLHFILMFDDWRVSRYLIVTLYCIHRASLSLIVYSLTVVTPIIRAKRHGAYKVDRAFLWTNFPFPEPLFLTNCLEGHICGCMKSDPFKITQVFMAEFREKILSIIHNQKESVTLCICFELLQFIFLTLA